MAKDTSFSFFFCLFVLDFPQVVFYALSSGQWATNSRGELRDWTTRGSQETGLGVVFRDNKASI